MLADNGLILVWNRVNTEWKEVMNMDSGGVKVQDLRWSGRGEKVCFGYGDGKVGYAIVYRRHICVFIVVVCFSSSFFVRFPFKRGKKKIRIYQLPHIATVVLPDFIKRRK